MSMVSPLARAHLRSEDTLSFTLDEFDEEKIAPQTWFDMVGHVTNM